MISYDLTGTENAMTAAAANVAAITPYVTAMTGLTLGPQELVLDGSAIGSWDPLSNIPGLEAALQTVQDHCATFQFNVIEGLKFFPGVLSSATGPAQGPGIVYDLATVLSILQALQGSPTPAQREAVDNALQDVETQIGSVTSYLNDVQSAAATFVTQLSGDIQTLTQGSFSISNAISQANTAYENAVIQYSGAFGSGIVAVIEQVMNQVLGGLQAVQSSINAAIDNQQPVAQAVNALEDIFTALGNDYITTIEAVQEASDADFGSILKEFDIQNAQSYWANASTFATNHGL